MKIDRRCQSKPPDPKAETDQFEILAEPVAKPAPTPDEAKPIPAGDQEVEKFNVAADTGGGD